MATSTRNASEPLSRRVCTFALSAALVVSGLGIAGCTASQEDSGSVETQTSEQATPQKDAEETEPQTTTETAEPAYEETNTSMASEDNLTGWYQAIVFFEKSDFEPTIVSGSLEGSTMTLEGTLGMWDTQSGQVIGDEDTWFEGPFEFTFDENTKWYSSGGDQGQIEVDSEYVEQILATPSGLGFILELDNGYIVSATIAS